MFQTNKIAILLATYNGEKYLKYQIDSILSQSYTDWELFIHDDGSKDGTEKIIDNFCDKHPTKIHKIEGSSTGCARNNFFFLLRSVEAPFYMFCDQDDVWLEKKVENTYSEMKKLDDKKPNIVFTELKVVDSDLNVISESMSKYQKLDCHNTSVNRILIQNVCTGCTMMINRTLRDEMIKAESIDNIIMHDWWAALIASEFGNLHFIDEPQILYRQHGDNSVGAKNFGIKYIFSKFYKKEEIKKSLKDTEKQSKFFSETYRLNDCHLISQYGNLHNLNKIRHLYFYLSNNVLKNSFTRNIGLFIWG